ncbi:hypothetical protein F1B92_02750 [Campylobacter sp. FMV-PI01]|uniref:Uncharacterized protein n=1 Tax=Campylobacter portucalensis TaxID=2608384 RepID=A0A6L5WJU6_9BACT|nr:hypothetical protein [Campylobacter portucalensis]MSN96123.1 hypothetical protein [Campylobacter portucalensis]
MELLYDTKLETTFGMNLLKNKYQKNRHPKELAYNFENGESDTPDQCLEYDGGKNILKAIFNACKALNQIHFNLMVNKKFKLSIFIAL